MERCFLFFFLLNCFLRSYITLAARSVHATPGNVLLTSGA